jgi:pathogenesis-related protein 1
MRILFYILLFISQQSIAQNVPQQTGSQISQQDAQLFLDHHNKVRKEVKAEKLTWSNSLSAYAQQWAEQLAKTNNCRLVHSNCVDNSGKSIGENLFWGSDNTMYKPIDASISWYKEISKYYGQPIGGPGFDKYGQYTQMIWKNTKEVGVGVAYCSNGGIIVCANYYPAGNYIGQTPYK